MGNTDSSESSSGMNDYCWGVGFSEAYDGLDIMSSTPSTGDSYGTAVCSTNESWNQSFADGYTTGVSARDGGLGVNAGDTMGTMSCYPDGTTENQPSINFINIKNNPLSNIKTILSKNLISKEKYDELVKLHKNHDTLNYCIKKEILVNQLKEWISGASIVEIHNTMIMYKLRAESKARLLQQYKKENSLKADCIDEAMRRYGRWNEYYSKYHRRWR